MKKNRDNGRRQTLKKAAPENVPAATSRKVELVRRIESITGTGNYDLAVRIAEQIALGLVSPRPEDTDKLLVTALSMVEAMAPRNMTEAMLAVQTIATHEAALRFLEIATRPDQVIDRCELAMRWATRLMRLNLDQIEAMQKLRGTAGQQKVTVEHVHVHEGGQAIVGAVTADREGEGS